MNTNEFIVPYSRFYSYSITLLHSSVIIMAQKIAVFEVHFVLGWTTAKLERASEFKFYTIKPKQVY